MIEKNVLVNQNSNDLFLKRLLHKEQRVRFSGKILNNEKIACGNIRHHTHTAQSEGKVKWIVWIKTRLNEIHI